MKQKFYLLVVALCLTIGSAWAQATFSTEVRSGSGEYPGSTITVRVNKTDPSNHYFGLNTAVWSIVSGDNVADITSSATIRDVVLLAKRAGTVRLKVTLGARPSAVSAGITDAEMFVDVVVKEPKPVFSSTSYSLFFSESGAVSASLPSGAAAGTISYKASAAGLGLDEATGAYTPTASGTYTVYATYTYNNVDYISQVPVTVREAVAYIWGGYSFTSGVGSYWLLGADFNLSSPNVTDEAWSTSNSNVVRIYPSSFDSNGDPLSYSYETVGIGSATITYTAKTPYTVSGTIRATQTVNVNAVTEITKQPQSAVISGDTDKYTLSVDAKMSMGFHSMTFQWYKDGQPIKDATNSSYTIFDLDAGAGDYYVVVTASNGNNVQFFTTSEVATVRRVIPLPEVVEFDKVPTGPFTTDGVYTFSVKQYSDAMMCLWSSKNGTVIFSSSQGNTVTAQFTQPGDEVIIARLIHRDALNSDKTLFPIETEGNKEEENKEGEGETEGEGVEGEGEGEGEEGTEEEVEGEEVEVSSASFPVTVSSPTGSEAIAATAFTAYPNPTSGQVTVTGLAAGEVIKVYSLSGSLVATFTATSETSVIDLTNLPQGLYSLTTTKGAVKIIKN